MADDMTDAGARKTLISIAEAYDAIAKRAEKKTCNNVSSR
jgi:hypothetical protein